MGEYIPPTSPNVYNPGREPDYATEYLEFLSEVRKSKVEITRSINEKNVEEARILLRYLTDFIYQFFAVELDKDKPDEDPFKIRVRLHVLGDKHTNIAVLYDSLAELSGVEEPMPLTVGGPHEDQLVENRIAQKETSPRPIERYLYRFSGDGLLYGSLTSIAKKHSIAPQTLGGIIEGIEGGVPSIPSKNIEGKSGRPTTLFLYEGILENTILEYLKNRDNQSRRLGEKAIAEAGRPKVVDEHGFVGDYGIPSGLEQDQWKLYSKRTKILTVIRWANARVPNSVHTITVRVHGPSHGSGGRPTTAYHIGDVRRAMKEYEEMMESKRRRSRRRR